MKSKFVATTFISKPLVFGFALLTLLTLGLPLNFVILAPGPTTNLLDEKVVIKGVATNKFPTGELFSTSILTNGPSDYPIGAQVISAWLDGDYVVMPRNALYESNVNPKEASQIQKKQMLNSQRVAALAAFNFLSQIPKQPKPIWRPADVKISMKDVGGSSAGLAFALAVIAKTADPQLIAGRKIAVTGTISQNGKVGEIGGVDQKVLGAATKGVDIFLMPKANCASLSKYPKGMKIYAVKNLSEAVHALALSGTNPSIFSCPKK